MRPAACGHADPGACAGEGARSFLSAWWRIGAGAVLAANAMALSLAISTSEASAAERRGVHLALLGIALLSLLLLGGPLARAAWTEAKRARLTVEAAFLAGIGGALAASLTAMLSGRGSVYFEVASILLVVYAFGRQVGERSRARALRAALAWDPGLTATEIERPDGTVASVPASEVAVGDVVLVHPGRTIPVDGSVLAGEAFVREAEMTGCPFATPRVPGDEVFAGTHVVDATLRIRTTAPGGSRRIDAIARAVEEARSRPSKLERQADRVASWFLPLVLAVSGGTFAAWSCARGWEAGLYHSMAVLLVACPCAMGFATPLAVWSAIGLLARRGLVVHGGETIEKLASVDTAVFDKTGTLTLPEPTLAGFVVPENSPVEEAALRRLVAAVERASDHPIAAPFRDLDGEGEKRCRVESLRLVPAAGIEAEVADPATGRTRRVRLGTPERILEGAEERRRWSALRETWRSGANVREVAVVVDGRLAAAALVGEAVREAIGETVQALTQLRVRAIVMTGDRAGLPGGALPDTRVGLAPEDKLREVEDLAAAGRRVLFVGDGVNDAAAMAASAVSVAVAAGAPLAVEVAEGSWRGHDLPAFAWSISLCRETVRTIRANLRLAAAYNLAGVAVAAAGLLHPVVAAVLMTCSSLVVTWRATEPLRREEEIRETRGGLAPATRGPDSLAPAGEVAS